MKKKGVVVVGACNIDLISYVPRLPKVGETLHGKKFHMGFGGKGANQAVMAAKLGGSVSMITKLGHDYFGETTLDNFRKLGIDTRFVYFTDDAMSGVAPIAVDEDGRNSIVIITGSNDLLTIEEIEAARSIIAGAAVLVCQLEIPTELSLAALRVAREEGTTTILNPAPGKPGLSDELFAMSDIFCPNESEAELISGIPVDSVEGAESAARSFLERGAKDVLVTLGENGVLLVNKDRTERFPTEKVTAKDTTGAGDAFIGSLSFFLSEGYSIDDAIQTSNRIAAVSVQGSGTQTSFPNRTDLPDDLFL